MAVSLGAIILDPWPNRLGDSAGGGGRTIGRTPDLDDPVRLTNQPFLAVGDAGDWHAGTLRWKPHGNWNSDRGNDVEGAPWYKPFAGARVDDHHPGLARNCAAKELG